MKINKLFSLLLSIPLLFIEVRSKDSTLQENLKPIVDFEDVLGEDITPLQFSTKSIKDFFSANNKNIQTVGLKDRPKAQESKTSMFQKSFLKFIKEVYNDHKYAEAFSQNATHLVEFFELSNELNVGPETTYVGMRLFYNKTKACELIDDPVILQVLTALPTHLSHYFQLQKTPKKQDLSFLKKHIEQMMLSKFTEQLPEFQSKPDQFLSNLATEISRSLQHEFAQTQRNRIRKESRERLRQSIIRFIETALGKTIWNPKTPEGIWHSFLNIANNLQLLGSHGIIDHMDDLDDCLWSLIHRFCFFLDLAGASLPLPFYDEVEHDLTHGLVFFLENKEQDDGIKTKKEHLREALGAAKTKAIAYARKGLLTQPLML